MALLVMALKYQENFKRKNKTPNYSKGENDEYNIVMADMHYI